MVSYIRKLIEQGEHQQLDFKFCITDARKIARTLVAFSNTDGGKLLLGIKDNGAVVGVKSEEEFYMVEAAAQMYSRPPIQFKTYKWEVNGKTVLEITVPKSDKRPRYAQNKDGKWLVYIRVNDQNLLANNVLLKVWQRKKRKKGVYVKYTDKEKFLLEYLQKNSTITLSKFYRTAQISKQQAEKILVNFVVLNIIEIVFTEKLTFYKLSKNYNIE